MLTPDYLENVPAAMMRLWQQVEEDILQDVARRIGKMGQITATADWQLWRREQTRLCNREVLKILARYSGRSEAELRRIFQEAAALALEDDDRLYTSAGLDPPDPNTDQALLNLLNAGYEETSGTWQNLTATTAATVSQQFTEAADRAWLQVASGAFDYQTAVRRAVNGLAAHMAGVTYPTGHRDTLEVAVRRAVLTGVNQTAGKLQIARMEEMGWGFVEVSAHAGARPEHAKWQGRQYHRGGAITYNGKYYPDFERSTGYGTGAGLCGWNCRHAFFAIDPDLSEPSWTEEDLAALDAKNIAYKGKMYSRHEISQKQRALERKVGAAKKSYLAEDAAGLDTAQSAVKLKTARQNLSAFVRDTGGRNDSARTFVQGFGRSEASRATAQARRATTDGSKVARYTQEQYTAMVRSAARSSGNRLPIEGTADSVAELLREDGSVKQRRVYGADGRALLDYDTDDHGKPKWHPTGAHKHEYDYSRKKSRSAACTLTEFDLQYNQDIIREGENYHAPKVENSD